MSEKRVWKIFWDLQCPYSRKSWERLPEIKEKLGSTFDHKICLTSLLFHPQAFPAQCAASLIEGVKGTEAKLAFVNACFKNQELYMNAAIGDARSSEVNAIFAKIAREAGVLDGDFSEEVFISKINDWESAIKPAYNEHKEALEYKVYGTPKHVIDDKLVPDTESAWGAEEWMEKLKTL